MAKTSQTARKELKLPTLPAAVLELLKATRDESKSMAHLAQLAGHDPALAAQILRLANSPLLSGSKPVKSLSHAAIILGISTIRNLAVTISICQTFSRLKLPDSFSLKDFWQHSLTCAVISRIIARQVGYPAPEEAFLAGLLHDIGQLFLILTRPEAADKIVQDPKTGQTIISSEQREWGTDHAAEGARILSGWHIAPSIVDVVRFHHRGVEELKEASDLLKIVYTANLFSHYFAGQCRCKLDDLLTMTAEYWSWQPHDISSFREEIGGEIEEIGNSLGITIEWHGAVKQPKVDLQGWPKKEELSKASSDLAAITGTIEAMLEARSVDQLLEILFGAVTLLTDFESAILLLLRKERLSAVAARGTKDDAYAKEFKVPELKASIWDEAFRRSEPVSSDKWFEAHPKRIIDEQMETLLGGAFLVVPMVAQGGPVGALALGISGMESQAAEGYASVLRLLCSEAAVLFKGIRYRQWWEKEHIINENIVKYSPSGIVLTNKEAESLFMNPSALHLLGLSAQEAFGLDLFSLLAIPKKAKQAIDRLVPGRSLDLGRIELGRAEKGTHEMGQRWIGIRVSCVEILGFERLIFILNDETASVLLERERRQREKLLEIELEKRSIELEKAQLKLIQAEKSGIARNMAKKVVHEASNPLNVIKNFLNILKLQKEAGKIEADTIDTISREIDRVSRIIRQLTDLSRSDQIESGGRAADVREVLGQLLPIMEPVARQKGIRIETDIAPDLPPAAISPDKLKQLLMNLMKNAIEALSASPAEEGQEGLVSIRASKTDSGSIFIEVADNGPGIPEELRDRIFDPFVTTKKDESSGLGLSICLGIVEAAGGEIKLDEREGFGAVFRILLPISEKSSPEGGK